MAEKTIIIIGAGIAGLSAGCYAQMNGFRSQIFELHSLPGGLCTAWERKGYVFDGCIHYLWGTREGQPFYPLLHELGIVPQRDVFHHADLLQVISPEGDRLIAYADLGQLQDHMLAISLEDRPLIGELVRGVRDFCDFDFSTMLMKPREMWSVWDWRRFGQAMTPFLPSMAKWGMQTANSFARRFKHPFLKEAVAQMFGWSEIPMMAGLMQMAYLTNRNAGFPIGGSLEVARAVEKRYLELGGVIHYRSQVEKILVEDDRAVGVRLYNDEIHRADYILSAADGRGTLFDMLDQRYVPPEMRRIYDGRFPIHTVMQVSIGIRRAMTTAPHWAIYLLPKPMLIAGQEYSEMSVKSFGFDPTLAPEGCTALNVLLKTSYGYWQRIYGRRLYDTEQDQVADLVIGFLDTIYPGIDKDIDYIDVCTPLSYERYTGNWQGSVCGWLLTRETQPMMIQGMRKTLPGINNFYMAGHWVEPGGSVPVVAMSGRNAVQLICRDSGRPFQP